MNRIIFLDRDGTAIVDRAYPRDPALVAWEVHALEGLRRLSNAGYAFVLISNQSGLARGMLSWEEVLNVQERVTEFFLGAGLPLMGSYLCPHHPGGKVPELAIDCDCRKPKPGLIRQAVAELRLDLTGAWVIGDKPSDIELGIGLGLRTVLVRTGYGRESELALTAENWPTHVAEDLAEAADKILALIPDPSPKGEGRYRIMD